MTDNDREVLCELDLTSTTAKGYLLFMLAAGIQLYTKANAGNPKDVAEANAEHAEIVVLVHKEWPVTSKRDRAEMFEDSVRAVVRACSATGYTLMYEFADGTEIAFGSGLEERLHSQPPVAVRIVKAR